MAYIGNIPAEKYSAFQKQDFTTSATTSYTLDNPVANANELALFINNVRQEPTTAYSASGTTLTLTEATSSSDDMYCVYLGKAVQTVTPANNTITTAMIQDSAVTSAKLASGNLTIPNGNLLFDTASKGIYLGVTSATASNLLDDYEEGLHTVTATDTGGGATITMNTSYDQLAYTKIGRVVHVQGILLFSSISGSFTGTLKITLPFTSSDLQDASGRTVLSLGTYVVDFTSGTAPYLSVAEGVASANIRVSGDNITTGEGRPQSNAQLYIGGSYITDA